MLGGMLDDRLAGRMSLSRDSSGMLNASKRRARGGAAFGHEGSSAS
jgi:hypothetical protein